MEQTPAKHCKMKKGAGGERQRQSHPRGVSLSELSLFGLPPLSLRRL